MKKYTLLFLLAGTLFIAGNSAKKVEDTAQIEKSNAGVIFPNEAIQGTVERDVMIPMEDGVKLATDIYLPEGEGPFPVIIERTPYGRGDDEGFIYNAEGYAFIIQSCRGRANSEGDWEPFVNERADGLATHKWVLDQPWCNGTIGTTGGSYTGLTEWSIAAHTGPSHKAMFASNPVMDAYHDLVNIGGAFGLGTLMNWGSLMAPPLPGEEEKKEELVDNWDWDKVYRRLPLSEWDDNLGYEVSYMRNWVKHNTYDAYWEPAGIHQDVLDVDVPGVIETGWYDVFVNQTFKYVSDLRQNGQHENGRKQFVICGPAGHGGEDARDDGDDWDYDTAPLRKKWFAHWLKGEALDFESIPAYRLFVMGRNEWRTTNEWPLPQTQFTPWYLHSNGSANTLNGDGRLSAAAPDEQPTDTYSYDPNDPVPTTGGCHLAEAPIGAHDQRQVEQRKDVLVYTSAPLTEELEVTGPVRVVLYAASSATDTDWTAKLVDVAPNGTAYNLCDGIQRARWRISDKEPTLIEPGKVYRYEIDLWVTSNAFLPGHRIRVEISSSNFPRFDRNPNTGNAFGQDAEMRIAEQRIYHNKMYPSHIVLPIIPAKH